MFFHHYSDIWWIFVEVVWCGGGGSVGGGSGDRALRNLCHVISPALPVSHTTLLVCTMRENCLVCLVIF